MQCKFYKKAKINELISMLENIRLDLLAFTKDGSFLDKFKCVLISHAFHLVAFYRIGVSLSKVPILGRLLRVLMEYFIRIFFSSDISLKSKIGPGLVIVHGHDIVIGGEVHIGKRCKILNGVTLGNKDTESSINKQPILGDDVIIGSGAKLLGFIKIGNNVIVGANSVVMNSFPSNAIVAGVPAKVVKYIC